jgi:SET domain
MTLRTPFHRCLFRPWQIVRARLRTRRPLVMCWEFRVQSPRRNQVSSRAKNDFNCVSSGDLVPNAAPSDLGARRQNQELRPVTKGYWTRVCEAKTLRATRAPAPSARRESSYMRDMVRKKAFRIGRSRTGLGLFATAPIKKGAFIVEYKGRKLTNEQADKLEARGNRYLYEINSRWTIDGTRSERTSDAMQTTRAGPMPRPTR